MRSTIVTFFISALLVTLGFAQDNLISNGSFENWSGSDPDSWTMKTGAITAIREDSVIHGGAASAKVEFTSTSTQKIGQTVTVSENTNYTFNAWVLDDDAAARFRIWGHWKLSDGGTVTLNPGSLYSADSSDWQLYTYQETSPAGAISLDFELRFYDVSPWPGKGTIYVDDLEIFGPPKNAPEMDSLTYLPFQADTPIDISCNVSVAGGSLDSVKLYHLINLDSISLQVTDMTPGRDSKYSVTLAGLPNGTSLSYMVRAWGNGLMTCSKTNRVIIGIPEIGMFHSQLDSIGLPEFLDHLARLQGIVTVSTGIFAANNYDFFMQDETGGINVFSLDTIGVAYSRGDSLEVVGKIDHYHGKVEITDFSAKILSSGNPLPTPIDVNVEDFGEEYEGRLVMIDNVNLAAGSDTWPAGSNSANLTITDDTGEITLRIIDSTCIGGNPAPSWPVTVVGIGGQDDSSAPYFSRYQVIPRAYSDLIATPIPNSTQVVYRYRLEQNYPNPFNPQTQIAYELKKSGMISFNVYNILGQIVFQATEYKNAGPHSILFSGSELNSGVYLYKLTSENFHSAKKMILVK